MQQPISIAAQPMPQAIVASPPAVDITDTRAAERSAATRTRNDYAELKARVRAAGLLERQPHYYAIKIAYTLALLGLGIAALLLFDNFWARAATAVYLAFIFAQVGFLGHDIGHKQIFVSNRAHLVLGLFMGNLLMGMSLAWWNDKHNAHHANPNHTDLDPDLDIPFVAWGAEDIAGKGPIGRWFVKYQALIFFPATMLAAVDFHLSSFRYVFTAPAVRWRWVEATALVAHLALYFGGLVWLLGPGAGLLFAVVNKAILGLILSSVFAPNHKGMEIIGPDCEYDFLRKQVLTARNVRNTTMNNWFYGGLNLQIEHHLFPAMSRNLLPEAQRMTRDFCAEKGIAYHETTVVQSVREILACLHDVGRELRARK